jgi:heavy metal sensor kinase
MMRSLRIRLAVWYALTLVVGLGVMAASVYLYVAHAARTRVDADLRNAAAAVAELWRHAPDRGGPPTGDYLGEGRAADLEFVVFDEGQRELASNSQAARLRRARGATPVAAPDTDSLLVRPDLAPLFREARTTGDAYATLDGPLGRERAYAVTTGATGRRLVVAVIHGLESEERFLAGLRRSFRILIPLAATLALLGGVWLAGRALRPVRLMAAQAARIGATTLDERLPASARDDELGRLAASFNQLLDRLETAFAQQQRFMAEASHELRTPIAVVRGEADLALSQPHRDEGSYRETLRVVAGESRRLTQIVDDLFLLARADAGQLPVDHRPVDLAAVAATSCRALRTVAAQWAIRLETSAEGAVTAWGDDGLLRRLVDNLVRNAVAHGRRGGTVTVRVSNGAEGVRLTVEDEGPGIAPEVRDRIFERFYRGPAARAAKPDQGGGAGLGLAIARGIAEAHGGTVVLARTGPDGSVFELRLPQPPRDPGAAPDGRD